MKRLTCLVGVVLAIAAAPLLVSTPSAQSARAVEVSLAHFNANRAVYGLSNPSAELKLRSNRPDIRGVSHVRFDQVYRGLPVFEGEAIAHVDASDDVTVTNALRPNISLDTAARIGRNAAVATAVGFIAPLGQYEVRDASLMILPRGERSVADRLVWHVAVLVQNDLEDPAEWRYFIDARDGSVAWSFDNLETTDNANGSARTMYSGNQTVHTDATAGTFFLRNVGSENGSYTCDQGNKSGGKCTTFSRSNNIFGNNLKNNSDRATAGADAHFGLQATWNYYLDTFGRNGINGAGRQTYSRVHYGRNYENAFWSDSCFCMTYGDGASTFFPLVSLDVAGHEMSHGVMAAEANLTYSGESGGLNESNSDIFGTMVEFSANSALDVPDYWIGERIYRANWSGSGATTYTQNNALRYMDDPAKDGRSPACWYSGIGNLNVHYSSGPNNHMFYLLAHGGTSKCNSQSVAGIGNDKAARIWYDAIANRMTASTDYHGARTAALAAATALYGTSERNAVAAAFSAIDVN